MKKSVILGGALLVAVSFTGCKSSESAYKKAYEKAKAQEQTTIRTTTTVTETPVVTSVRTTQVQRNYDNEPVRRENVSVVSGTGLKAFSVVVGSFGVKTNAEGLHARLRNEGYDAQIVYNSANDMYRVIASSFDSKAFAVQSRNQFRATYPDAWLLAK